ncbi:MAG TPA: ankyrin repeat domain-containing protein [Pyrinomonadaceae bacterium]|nr:ankyrin repeat domain-containing protein [Pyrinomonadaceae bacterium]
MSATARKFVVIDTAIGELWRVAESGDVNELAAILSRGVNVNARNEHGMTALMRAARHGNAAIVRELLEHGADPNIARNDKFTALALAAFFGHTETVRILIEYGAKTEIVTRSGTSPRMWATARTYSEVARCFERPVTAPSPAPVPIRPAPVATAPLPEVRTLKDPPEIWDLVHEVPRDFNARDAFLSRIKSMKWLVAAGAFAGLLFLVACGAGVFILRSPEASIPSIEVPPVLAAAVEVQVIPTAAVPVESSVSEAPVVVSKRAPVWRESKPRVVTDENVVAVTPSREEPQVAIPEIQKPKPRESPKSPPNASLSPHLIAPAKGAKVIQWP